MSDASKRTIIEDGTEFEGSVKSRCPVTVGGSVTGSMNAPALTVTKSGAVHGQVEVSELKSAGEISGEIDAGACELAGTVGDQTIIRASTLEVKLNQPQGGMQVTFGNCDLIVENKKADSGREPVAASSKSERKAESKAERDIEIDREPEPVL